MKNIFLFSVSLYTFFLFSCNNSDTKEESVKKDSPLTNESFAEHNNLTALFKNTISLPLKVDSTYLAKEKFEDSLGTREVKLLSENRFKHELMDGLGYDLNEFYKIDSIKATGTYLAWSEKLDIGMTKYANAYAIGKIDLQENITLLVWAFKIESYEACPWSNETAIYFTIIKNGALEQTFIIGESFGAGDAPVWMTREVYGILSPDGSIQMNWKQVNDDADGTETEIEERKYNFAIKDGHIELIKEEKGKPYRIPHHKESE